MTQKEFIRKLASNLQWDESNTSEVIKTISNILTEQLSESKVVSIENFALFGTQKNQEYILINSETGERYLMPPEVVVLFEPYQDNDSESNQTVVFEADELLKKGINGAFHNFKSTLINEGVEFPGIKVVTTQEQEDEISEPEPVDVSVGEPAVVAAAESADVSVAESSVIVESGPEPPVATKTIQSRETHAKSKSRSRKSSNVLIPILGGVVIVMATLFFFNGVAKRKS